MSEFFRDPIWQFVGALLALLAIGISIYFFFLQRKKKALSYRILTDTELLTVDEQIKGEIKIIYGKLPIQNVHLLVMKVENNGNMPILSSDFEEPLLFSIRRKGKSFKCGNY